MKKCLFFIFSVIQVMWLTGCDKQAFTSIPRDKEFVASLNIQQPSLDFVDKSGELFASWQLDKAFTGAVLLEKNEVLLYGNQLDQAVVYSLDTGEQQYTIETGIGVTNGYYWRDEKTIFMTNGDTNTVTSYDTKGKKVAEQQVGNYPMSMATNKDQLYVVNYKDTNLTVLNAKNLKIEDQWPIEKSSHGIVIIPERNELWLGGHGEGSKPNTNVKRFELSTGERKGAIEMPLMPVGLTKVDEQILVVSHGHNELYVADYDGQVTWHLEIGANPFVVEQFNNQIIVAGYDDQTLYFIEDGEVVQTVEVGKGPFQLLVREEQS